MDRKFRFAGKLNRFAEENLKFKLYNSMLRRKVDCCHIITLIEMYMNADEFD